MGKRNIIHAVALSNSDESNPIIWAILLQPKNLHKRFRVETPPAILLGYYGNISHAPRSAIVVKILLGENDVGAVESKVRHALRDLPSSTLSRGTEGNALVDDNVSGSTPAAVLDPWLGDAVTALQHAHLIEAFSVPDFLQVASDAVAAQNAKFASSSTQTSKAVDGNPVTESETEAATTILPASESQQPSETFVNTTPNVLEIDHEGHPLRQASADLEQKIADLKQREKNEGGGGGRSSTGGWGFWVSHGPNASNGPSRRRVARERNSWEREDDAYGGLM